MNSKAPNDHLKEQHEKAVGDSLLKALGVSVQFIGCGAPQKQEPDLLYRMGDRCLGVEVTTAYYDNNHSRAEWGEAREKLAPDTKGRMIMLFADIDPDQRMISSVQDALRKKGKKVYSGTSSVWLCIQARDRLASLDEMAALVKKLDIPKQSSFERLFLVWHAPCGEGSGIEVFDLVSKEVFGCRR